MCRNVRKPREYSTARNNLILSTSARRNAEANTTNSTTSDISCCIIVLFYSVLYCLCRVENYQGSGIFLIKSLGNWEGIIGALGKRLWALWFLGGLWVRSDLPENWNADDEGQNYYDNDRFGAHLLWLQKLLVRVHLFLFRCLLLRLLFNAINSQLLLGDNWSFFNLLLGVWLFGGLEDLYDLCFGVFSQLLVWIFDLIDQFLDILLVGIFFFSAVLFTFNFTRILLL